MNRDELKVAFEKIKPSYQKLSNNIKDALVQFLDESGIEYLDIEERVKTFDSFLSKIEKKGYGDPLLDVSDICGLRIINYYPSDLKKIGSIIANEFEIIESSNKEEEMGEDRFGYRSLHFVGKIKKDWLMAPNFRGLDGLKFEIQARTILMHGWASINHKLSYKNEIDVPKKFRRSLFRLSALIEMADEQFEILREERRKYAEGFVDLGLGGGGKFIPDDEINSDSLQAMLNFYFPDREKSKDISSLVGELRILGIGLNEFNTSIMGVLNYLDKIELEEGEAVGEVVRWTQDGAARTVLDITNDEYFSRHKNSAIPDEMLVVIKRWRKNLYRGG